MELLIVMLLVCLTITVYFQWVIIAFVVIIGMAQGGFLTGLGAGVVAYFLIKFSKWIGLAYIATSTVKKTFNKPQ